MEERANQTWTEDTRHIQRPQFRTRLVCSTRIHGVGDLLAVYLRSLSPRPAFLHSHLWCRGWVSPTTPQKLFGHWLFVRFFQERALKRGQRADTAYGLPGFCHPYQHHPSKQPGSSLHPLLAHWKPASFCSLPYKQYDQHWAVVSPWRSEHWLFRGSARVPRPGDLPQGMAAAS